MMLRTCRSMVVSRIWGYISSHASGRNSSPSSPINSGPASLIYPGESCLLLISPLLSIPFLGWKECWFNLTCCSNSESLDVLNCWYIQEILDLDEDRSTLHSEFKFLVYLSSCPGWFLPWCLLSEQSMKYTTSLHIFKEHVQFHCVKNSSRWVFIQRSLHQSTYIYIYMPKWSLCL